MHDGLATGAQPAAHIVCLARTSLAFFPPFFLGAILPGVTRLSRWPHAEVAAGNEYGARGNVYRELQQSSSTD